MLQAGAGWVNARAGEEWRAVPKRDEKTLILAGTWFCCDSAAAFSLLKQAVDAGWIDRPLFRIYHQPYCVTIMPTITGLFGKARERCNGLSICP